MKRITALAAAVLAPALAWADVATWNIDTSHTEAGFSVRHLVISTVKGNFGKTTGTVKLDPADPSKSSVEATIDIGSVNTRNEERDKHLRSPDFFDVAKYPTMTFKSTKVEKAGDGLKVTGDLTIKAVTKPVVLTVAGPTGEVKDPWGNTRRGLQAKGKINRQDFGVTWSKVIEAGPVVGDEVAIEIDAELVKAK